MVEAFRGQMDEVERMKECLRILEVLSPGAERGESSEETHSDLERRESALDVLAELCENLDNAAGTETTSYIYVCVCSEKWLFEHKRFILQYYFPDPNSAI